MDEMQLLIELHRTNPRQGPGGVAETKRALELAGLDHSRPLKVADIGCGTGAGTILLAKELDATITAVDFLQEFLDDLHTNAKEAGVADRITTLNCSMDALPFENEEFDVIWSEGAIYNMGFEAGVAAWWPFLKDNGMFVASEITWLSAARPAELQSFWEREYPEIDLASSKMAVLERHGYRPEAYFVLPPHCWLENYYQPLQQRFESFLEQHERSPQARAIVEEHQQEIALYEKYCDYYSYGVYIAKKCKG